MTSLTIKLSCANFGASTFFASAHPSESCGSNGLPLTPNSIRILGHAQVFYRIQHPNLCTYIHVFRGKHERMILVQEYYPLNVHQACRKYSCFQTEKSLKSITNQILLGLAHLQKFGIVCRNLAPQNILVDAKGCVKLYGFGLFYMTESGSTVDFPIGTPKYLPPEVLFSTIKIDATSDAKLSSANPSWDSWSLGLIVLEAALDVVLFENADIFTVVKTILSIYVSEKDFVDSINAYHGLCTKFKNLNEELQDFIRSCLNLDVENRPIPSDLLLHPYLADVSADKPNQIVNFHFPAIDPSASLVDRSKFMSSLKLNEEAYKDQLPNYPHENQYVKNDTYKQWRFSDIDHLSEKDLRMVYHWWKLAGGNLEQELKRQKVIHSRPPVLTLPSVVSKECEMFGGDFLGRNMLPSATVVLPLDNLRSKLSHIPPQKFYPLITQGENSDGDLEVRNLPLVIREKDVEYQFHRMILFERLLRAYPYKADHIFREAKKDIPPFYRALIWACLLNVDGSVQENYERIDKETPTSTDRQIEVDIPRCHQYDELLSSPSGHAKFKRVLKAWVVSHPHLVYWQGLDSLCAPFLYLNFENEALTYACFSSFISKYLHKFFLRDNSDVIQEYLAKFSHLVAFHDPALFSHLHSIGFIPELYAIPWFLTMFTHVFPLHKIFSLWDSLLLGDSSLPLFVGLGLLRQLKDRLIQFGFNECILLFSDMPDINMELVVNDAKNLFRSTPPSLTFRKHAKMDPNTALFKDASSLSGFDSELLIDEVSLQELKSELCARISAADLLKIRSQNLQATLVIDIRPTEEFNKGALPHAISIPHQSLLSPEGDLLPASSEQISGSCKSKIVVVAGSRESHNLVVKISEALLLKGIPRVCTLHKGIDVFRGSRHLAATCS